MNYSFLDIYVFNKKVRYYKAELWGSCVNTNKIRRFYKEGPATRILPCPRNLSCDRGLFCPKSYHLFNLSDIRTLTILLKSRYSVILKFHTYLTS